MSAPVVLPLLPPINSSDTTREVVGGGRGRTGGRERKETGARVLEQAVAPLRGRSHVLGDQDGDDERVDGDDTGHDDGDQALFP